MIQQILNSPTLVILIVSGIGLMLVAVGFFLVPTNTSSRLNDFVESPAASSAEQEGEGQGKGRLTSFRARINTTLSFISSDKLRAKLASAHWPISDHEYIILRTLGTIVGFVVGWLIPHNILGGIGLAIILYTLPGFLLVRSVEVRRQKFATQLLDALVLIRGAVQSGYSLLQSLDLVARETSAPASEEFGRVVREVQLGLPLNQALLNLSARMENDDLYMVVTSIIINLQVGGNLTTMLTAVTDTIRARIYLFGEIRALTSYARYAAYLLTALPFLTGLLIFLLNPTYFNKVPGSLISQIILGIAAVLLLLGNIWLRRIVKIKV